MKKQHSFWSMVAKTLFFAFLVVLFVLPAHSFAAVTTPCDPNADDDDDGLQNVCYARCEEVTNPGYNAQAPLSFTNWPTEITGRCIYAKEQGEDEFDDCTVDPENPDTIVEQCSAGTKCENYRCVEDLENLGLHECTPYTVDTTESPDCACPATGEYCAAGKKYTCNIIEVQGPNGITCELNKNDCQPPVDQGCGGSGCNTSYPFCSGDNLMMIRTCWNTCCEQTSFDVLYNLQCPRSHQEFGGGRCKTVYEQTGCVQYGPVELTLFTCGAINTYSTCQGGGGGGTCNPGDTRECPCQEAGSGVTQTCGQDGEWISNDQCPSDDCGGGGGGGGGGNKCGTSGACTPGQQNQCFGGGVQVCQSNCTWGSCPSTHTMCDDTNFQCIQVLGSGTNECTDYSDCTAECTPGQTATCGTCGIKSCIDNGFGTGYWSACGDDPNRKLACTTGNRCDCVSGTGPNTCPVAGNQCGESAVCPAGEHAGLDTADCMCKCMPEAGEDECALNQPDPSCIPETCTPGQQQQCNPCGSRTCDQTGHWGQCSGYHLQCLSGQCTCLPGEGSSNCSIVGQVCTNAAPTVSAMTISENDCIGLPGQATLSVQWTYEDLEEDPQQMFVIQASLHKDFSDIFFSKSVLLSCDPSTENCDNVQQIYIKTAADVDGCDEDLGDNCALQFGTSNNYYIRVRVVAAAGNNEIAHWYYFDGQGTVTDNSSQAEFYSVADHPAPSPSFTFPSNPKTNQQIEFTDLSTCWDNSLNPYLCKNGNTDYSWTFGTSGSSSTVGDVAYTFTTEGYKSVGLQVCDSITCCATGQTVPVTGPKGNLPNYKEISPF